MSVPTIDPVLTSEAARILAVTPETIRYWERAGRLPARRTATGVRIFDRSDVEQFGRERAERQRQRRRAIVFRNSAEGGV